MEIALRSPSIEIILGSGAVLGTLMTLLIDWKKHFRSVYGGYATFLGGFFTLISISIRLYHSFPAIAPGFAALAFLLFLAFLGKARRYYRLNDRA